MFLAAVAVTNCAIVTEQLINFRMKGPEKIAVVIIKYSMNDLSTWLWYGVSNLLYVYIVCNKVD